MHARRRSRLRSALSVGLRCGGSSGGGAAAKQRNAVRKVYT
jgi:hypothetical protein